MQVHCNGLPSFRTIPIFLPLLLLSHRYYEASIPLIPIIGLTRHPGGKVVLALTKPGHYGLVKSLSCFSLLVQLDLTKQGHLHGALLDQGVPVC